MSLVFTSRYGGPAGFPVRRNPINGQTRSVMGMPAKFAGADGGASFAIGRSAFLSRPVRAFRLSELVSETGWSRSGTSINGKIVYAGNGKGPKVETAEEQIRRKKNNAIGRSSTKAGLADDALLSFRSQDRTSRNSALARVRGGGSVAPAKKGAVANNFKSGGRSSV
jgi:hypothetical protein